MKCICIISYQHFFLSLLQDSGLSARHELWAYSAMLVHVFLGCLNSVIVRLVAPLKVESPVCPLFYILGWPRYSHRMLANEVLFFNIVSLAVHTLLYELQWLDLIDQKYHEISLWDLYISWMWKPFWSQVCLFFFFKSQY